MAKIKGMNIPSGIVPYNVDDTYPTHHSEYGKGGWHEVETVAERDQISQDRLHPGMSCMVKENKILYILNDDYTWYEYLGESNAALAKEIQDRKDADTALDNKFTTNLNKEISDRTAADNALDEKFTDAINKEILDRTNAIDSEEAARIAADNTLTDNLNKEIADRTEAVTAEAQARSDADTALQNALNKEIQDRTTADSTLQSNLDNEETERKAADTTLQDNINAEATARENADTILTTNLNQEIADRKKAIEDLTTSTDASVADLNNKISAETQNRIDADDAITEVLNDEISDRKSADETLTTNLNKEISDRTAADTQLQNNINTETSERQSADSTLQSNIEAEATARTTADADLQSKIDTINSKIPTQASSTNQLADKNFVNSSIQTSTADFKGSWETYADIPTDASAYPPDATGDTTPKINDYLVVVHDENKDGGTWRYKYTGSWETDGKSGWVVEYQVNETPFTAEQLAAINSGITTDGVTQITTNKTNISNLQTSKQDNITGAASSITSTNLTAEKVAVSDSSGKIQASTVSTTELNMLLGVTSNIQEQLNAKQDGGDFATNTALNAEIQARTNADTALQSAINTEVTNRTDADTALQTQITTNTNNITGLTTDVNGLKTSKQNKLTAGNFINIDENNNISTTYTAGSGIAISPTGEISNTQTSAEWGNITGNIADQTDLQNALNEAGTPDGQTIVKTSDKKLQAIGVIEKNKSLVKIDWIGTLAEWTAGREAGTIPDEWTCYITDDFIDLTNIYSKTEVDAMIAQINAKFTDIENALDTILAGS